MNDFEDDDADGAADGNPNIKPGVAELCDGIDQDCDGIVDEGASVHCHLPNALNTCRFGQCAIFSCVPGYANANNDPADGCEAVVNPDDLLTTTPCTFDVDCNDGTSATASKPVSVALVATARLSTATRAPASSRAI